MRILKIPVICIFLFCGACISATDPPPYQEETHEDTCADIMCPEGELCLDDECVPLETACPALRNTSECPQECEPCQPCTGPQDCESRVCLEDGLCADPVCGDGIVNAPQEECEIGALDVDESGLCSEDCKWVDACDVGSGSAYETIQAALDDGCAIVRLAAGVPWSQNCSTSRMPDSESSALRT